MKFSWILLSFICCACAGNLEPIYPQPTYTKQLLYNSQWSTCFCLENGDLGLIQGTGDGDYYTYQHCRYGQVRLGTGGNYLEFGAIGRVASSIVDLGEYFSLATTLNVTDSTKVPLSTVYLSLSLCEDKENLCAADSVDSVGQQIVSRHKLNSSIYSGLLTTRSNRQLVPSVGHVYLVRLTEDEETTTQIALKTTLLFKVMVSNIVKDQSMIIEWTVFYGDSDYKVHPSPYDASSSGNGDKYADKKSTIAIILASLALGFAISAAACFIIFHFVKKPSTYTTIN